MSYKTRDGKTHQSTVLFGENGLPVDSIATIAGSYVFIEVEQALTYSSGGSLVTLPVGSDLGPVTTAKARYTGRYVLITTDGAIYYISRPSIDVINRTFTISKSDTSQVTPAAIDLTPGWKVAEADIVNRMATTSSAKIDSIEFRDMHFQMQLDGDPVTVRGKNLNTIEPNPDGSINVVPLEKPSVPVIINQLIPTANLVVTIVIPETTKRYLLRSRDPLSRIKIRFSTTGPYITLNPGTRYSEEDLDLKIDLPIYVESSRDGNTLEILYWT